jgi:hypothetical protein
MVALTLSRHVLGNEKPPVFRDTDRWIIDLAGSIASIGTVLCQIVTWILNHFFNVKFAGLHVIMSTSALRHITN